jgi:hypothetical protein
MRRIVASRKNAGREQEAERVDGDIALAALEYR